MSERMHYPAGVPCWVETLQPDPKTALGFYGPLFGWEFSGPGLMPGDPPGQYFVARLRGRDVAGIGSAPASGETPVPPAWNTHIRVDDVAESAEKAMRFGASLIAAPFDVDPAGRMAILADPAGAAICLWQPGIRAGAQLVNEPSAWAMSSLISTDLDQSIAFYRAVFGWQPEQFGSGDSPVTLFRLPGYVGGEANQPVPRDVVAVMSPMGGRTSPTVPPAWRVGFWIADADAAAEHAAALGGTIIEQPRDVPGFRTAVLADPQGAAFSISQLVI